MHVAGFSAAAQRVLREQARPGTISCTLRLASLCMQCLRTCQATSLPYVRAVAYGFMTCARLTLLTVLLHDQILEHRQPFNDAAYAGVITRIREKEAAKASKSGGGGGRGLLPPFMFAHRVMPRL